MPLLRSAIALAAAAVIANVQAAALAPNFDAEHPSVSARFAVQSILASGEPQGRPFAVVDKPAARLYVFDAEGRLSGAAPVLLGQAPGDRTVPGVGDKAPADVLPHERTTPAGRFLSEPGRNLGGDKVVWVDYDSGFAIHRVRPGASYGPRMRRLSAASPKAHRASLGCVVVAPTFFDQVVWPVLGQGPAMVYVLPETRPVASLFAKPAVALAAPEDTATR